MITTMTKNSRVVEFRNVMHELVSDFPPYRTVNGEINDDGVPAVVDLVHNDGKYLKDLVEGRVPAVYLTNPVVVPQLAVRGSWSCWWSNRDVEPQMTTWELLEESINTSGRFDTVDGTNSITLKRCSGSRLMVSDYLDSTSFALGK